MNNEDSNFDFSIAVIGLAGRFPGAISVKEFWENLINGKESITFFTDEEMRESGIDQKLIDNPSYVKARGIIGDSEYFDASFFGYSPREAEILDPQHRIILECAWHAMEDAGYDPFKTSAKIGIFGGTGVPWYHLEISKNPQLQAIASGMSVIIGNEKDYLSTRVAYKLNLTGTSISIQCACSTSLAAIVLGMQSLLTHQNDMVLAGGVSINFPEKQGYLYEKGGLDSPNGHCRTFDAGAQGTVFSSGAGIVLLKRLSDAIRDKDNIYCILKGGSINNDGFSKVSYTAPSIDGQVAVEIDALEMAGVNPETISYVEAHGTATQIGDPIEIKALTQAFRQYTSKNNFCAIGSIKTNIGHTDVASGVIGLIKIALSLKNRIIPASLHFETPNPQIDFDQSPFYVNVETKHWETTEGKPRRAAINSFGVGGTNACVILEESPVITSDISQRSQFLLLISARTDTSLNVASSNILKYVIDNPEINLADLAYSLQVGRTLFEHRRQISFSNRSELIESLSDFTNKSVLSIVCVEKEQDVIFMFPGQGNQYFGMGKGLYNSEPFFRKQVDYCFEVLNKNLAYEYNLKKILFSADEGFDDKEFINQTIIAQPVLFIIEFALAKFLISLGVLPKALIGHSIGEFVAACISDVISIEDALMIVIARARMTQSLPKGSMLAIFSENEEVAKWVKYPNEIAVINSLKLTIVSGPTNEILAFEEELFKKKISCKKLNTSHAFHSHMMDELIEPLRQIISKVKLSPPKIPIMSTVTANWMSDKEAQDPVYWAQHARKPVCFSSAAQRLLAENSNFFIEVGPGHSLESAIKNCSNFTNNKIVGLMGSVLSYMAEDKFFNIALGKIWALGGKISFHNLYKDEKRKRLTLPGYPFERKKFLLNFKEKNQKFEEDKTRKKEDIGDWFYLPSWKRSFSLNEMFDCEIHNENAIWIIFENGDDFGSKLIRKLRNSNQTVCSVQISDSYKEEGLFNYFINQAKAEDYSKLFERIKKRITGSCRIIHLWNFIETSNNLQGLDQINEIENRSFYGLLFLEQALVKSNLIENLYLTFVANDIYNVINDEVNILQSLIIGPCRVFKNEYPRAQSRLIDVCIPKSADEQEKLTKVLVSENLHVSDEIVIAYRNFSRWLPVYEPTYLSSENIKRRSLRDQGTYIITGGMGGIGLTLAKFIAESVNAKIILIQRSSFPDRSEWQSWLECRGDDDHISKKIKKIEEIEALGSSLILMKADIASFSEMEIVVNQIFSSYPKINGVFHCAGAPGGGVILLKSPEKAAGILKSKVRGTLILEKLLKNQDMDFFISCSSISGILGEQGQVDYCSANAFLDAFSNSRNISKPGVYASINWGAWDIIGMAVENRIRSEDIESHKLSNELLKRLQVLSIKEEEETYQVVLDQQRDWFIHNHRLKGIPTLVGTAFFEFLIEYSKEKQPNATCIISNIHFVSPLMFFSESEKSLKLKIFKQNSVSRFTFFSQSKGTNDKNEGGQEHLHGEISLQKDKAEESIDLDHLIGVLKEDLNIRKIHEDDPDSLLWVGFRWKSAKRVFKGERQWLAHLALPDIYQNEVENFTLHPALLDFATSFSLAYSVDVLHLPYSYEKVMIFYPLENEIFSYARQKDVTDDFITLDIDLLNKKGKVLVRIQGYTLKKISESSRTTRFKDSKKGESENILPSEGIEAFARFFNQLILPQVIICSKDFNYLVKENEPSVEAKNIPVKKILIDHFRPQLFTPYSEPSNEIEKAVTSIWETILGMKGLGIDDNFIELGGNSLTAIQVIAQLTEIFTIEFSVDSFLTNPTIRTISDFIVNQLIETLDEEKLNEIVSSIE